MFSKTMSDMNINSPPRLKIDSIKKSRSSVINPEH